MKSCDNCKFRAKYTAKDNQDQHIFICEVDGWESEEDGSYKLTEVSTFDAKNCLLFREKT